MRRGSWRSRLLVQVESDVVQSACGRAGGCKVRRAWVEFVFSHARFENFDAVFVGTRDCFIDQMIDAL